MQWVFDGEGRIKDRVVLAVVLGALALGLVLYSVVPTGGGEARAATPTAAIFPDADRSTADAGAGAGSTGDPIAPVDGGSSFGAAVNRTAATALVHSIVGGSATAPAAGGVGDLDTGAGPATGGAPSTPSAPAPECATAPVSDAYEEAADQIAAALGQRVPRDNLRLLLEIAAGCSTDTPTTPLLGLALDLARLVPSTGLPPVDLSAIPAVPAPALPQQVIDALAPANEQIMEACGTVGMLSIIVAVVPSTAGIPVTGSELADLLVPAQTLCAQFEPVYE